MIYHEHAPDNVIDEALKFVEVCRETKTSIRIGTALNPQRRFQIPKDLLPNSILVDYLKRLGLRYMQNVDGAKNINIVCEDSVWINFYDKGDYTEEHVHASSLSGILYLTEYEGTPTEFTNGQTMEGSLGDIIIFPSDYEHKNPIKESDPERITLAFNLKYHEL